MTPENDLQWLTAENGYQLAIEVGPTSSQIKARNAKGKDLKSVPAAVKKTETYAQLDALLGWLVGHEKQCADQVEAWLLRSLPVPTTVIAEVWPDEAWRRQLVDLVVATDDTAGFLRDAVRAEDSPTGRPQLGVVDLDGESATIDAEVITIPHPALLEDLDDLREFAAELGIEQSFNQLHREVFRKPDPLPNPTSTGLNDWADARFEQLRFAAGRASSAGFSIKGGYAVARVHENDRLVEASYWIGAEAPDWETWTGELSWIADGTALPLSDVGPVAWSEGVRMARHIHAGRTIEKSEEDQ